MDRGLLARAVARQAAGKQYLEDVFRGGGLDLVSRILYFDCFSGISGDMALGALLDSGLPLEDLKRALGSLALSGCEVSATRVLRTGISATKFVVHEGAPINPDAPKHRSTDAPKHDHGHDHYSD